MSQTSPNQKRKVMLICEVANEIRVTEQHVLNLIEAGDLVAIDVGTGNRSHWRIPLECYEAYKAKRSNLNPGVVK